MKDRIRQALLRRRNQKDTFREKYGYSWDCAIVFKVYDEDENLSINQIECNMKYVLSHLTAGGLEFRLFYSMQVS